MRELLVSARWREPPNLAVVVRNYTTHWIKNPDPGSKFERQTKFIRWLPGRMLIHLLEWKGYDGLLFLEEDSERVIGHAFFQRHDDTLHLFSAYVEEERRGTGLGKSIIRGFLMHAWGTFEMNRARLGAGNSEAMVGLWRQAHMLNLPFSVVQGEEDWVYLR